ncbi:MAG: hypothetical protein ACYSUC_13110 [Planctomycetota bacterium]|jgi:hypothetical protein
MPDARYNVSVNFTVPRAGSGFQQMQNELGRIANATEQTAKKGSLRWTELKSQIDLVTGGLRTVAKVGQQVFEFGREGAQITQTTESFELMNKEIFKTPDLMERMRASSRGTISDVQLMQGVLKLTAGTSNELGAAMAGAAPKLLEIAKASNKLNPALGDTAFLYDSISTGIKRASPLILDNLGIVVKVGDANQKYADVLGKTVAALTAEEKQMALLNATMEAGDQLIKQVGGDVDSAADSYARLEVKVENATNKLKEFASEALLPVIEGVEQSADAITGEYGAAVDRLVEDNVRAAKSLEDLKSDAQGLEEALSIGGGFGAALTGTSQEIERGVRLTAVAMESFAGSQADFEAMIEESFGVRSQNALRIWTHELGITREELFQFIHNLRLAGESADADRKFFFRAAEATEALGDAVEDTNDALTGQARTNAQARRVLKATEKAAADL